MRDNLRVIEKGCAQYTTGTMSMAIDKCLELEVYNANTLMEIAEYIRISRNEPKVVPIINLELIASGQESRDAKPETSKISTYQNIIEQVL
jgi:hypothetical protein